MMLKSYPAVSALHDHTELLRYTPHMDILLTQTVLSVRMDCHRLIHMDLHFLTGITSNPVLFLLGHAKQGADQSFSTAGGWRYGSHRHLICRLQDLPPAQTGNLRPHMDDCVLPQNKYG